MKIGIFDSGLGGLTVADAILKKFNNVQVFYVADTGAAPYGHKSKNEILEHSFQVTEYLIQHHNIDALVVACNTATSAAIKELREEFPDIILVGTEPGIKPAISSSKTGNIGVLATMATLNGEKYSTLAAELSSQNSITLYEQACPGLVEKIEQGNLDTIETLQMLQTWLDPMKANGVDTIVLGCTHYPMVSGAIKKIMGDEIDLIETGDAIAGRLEVLSSLKEFESFEKTEAFIYTTGNINKNVVDMILDHWVDCGKITIR